MIGERRVVALLPMREGSERVRGKNHRPCAGKPLFHWVLQTLLDVSAIDQVVIDTDSGPVADDVGRHFPTVTLIDRPDRLRGGHVPMNAVIAHDVEHVRGDLFVQTHATSPLLARETVARALETMVAALHSHDSLFTVTALRARLWSPDGAPLNHDPSVLERTQDMVPVMIENSALYVFPRATIEAHGRRIGSSPIQMELSALQAWDVDDEVDFRIAESLLARHHGGPT